MERKIKRRGNFRAGKEGRERERERLISAIIVEAARIFVAYVARALAALEVDPKAIVSSCMHTRTDTLSTFPFSPSRLGTNIDE